MTLALEEAEIALAQVVKSSPFHNVCPLFVQKSGIPHGIHIHIYYTSFSAKVKVFLKIPSSSPTVLCFGAFSASRISHKI